MKLYILKMANTKLIDILTREKNTLFFFVLLLFALVPLLEGNLVLVYLTKLYKDNIQEFDSETIIKVMQGLIYAYLYTALFIDMFIRIIVFSVITFFVLSMLEDSMLINYKDIVISFLAIELVILTIKLLYIIGDYTYIQFTHESFQYIGTKLPFVVLLDLNFSKPLNYILNTITIELALYLLFIGCFLKIIFKVKTLNILTIILFNFLLYILFEVLNPIQSVFFNSEKLGA